MRVCRLPQAVETGDSLLRKLKRPHLCPVSGCSGSWERDMISEGGSRMSGEMEEMKFQESRKGITRKKDPEKERGLLGMEGSTWSPPVRGGEE